MIASNKAILRYRIIDRCIRSTVKPFPTKEELRSACEEELFGSVDGKHICDSTIEKDLYALRMEHDAPIKFSKSKGGYYYSNPNYSIDEIPLNDKDVEAIKMAANILDQFKNAAIFKQFNYAIGKILDRVNVVSTDEGSNVDKYVQFETMPSTKGSEYLEPILDAIKGKKKIQFLYQSFSDTESKLRRVHPYLLKEYRHRWYLICKNELKEKVQTFGLDRISELSTLEEKFTIDNQFDPNLFFSHSIGITANNGNPEKIVFQTDELLSKYLLSQPLHESQEYLGGKKNKHQFSLFLLPSYELKMILLGHGSALKVLEPQSLCNEIKLTLKEMAKNYKGK
jgi:predicted DNA-binding transcriptional regulator YafY